METTTTVQQTILRTERGLTIAGTRITLYDVMDYVTAGWPPTLIRDRLNLSDEQIRDVLTYIHTYRAEVEAEYQQVLQIAEEQQCYWEHQNRERFARLATLPPPPDQEALRAKLAEWKARLAAHQ